MTGLGAAEVGMLLGLGLMFFFYVPLVAVPAYQAYHRGYNPVVWGLAGIFSLNPLFILVVLAMSPHRARVRLRQRFRDALDRKLTAAGVGPAEEPRAAVRVDTNSLGDQMTEMPQRSVGDDLTRM